MGVFEKKIRKNKSHNIDYSLSWLFAEALF